MRFSAKIGLTAAATALLVGPLLGITVFFEARSILRERIAHEQLTMAKSVMREIDSAIHRAYKDVNVIAADELLRDAMDLPDRQGRRSLAREELDERARLTGPWESLVVFDARGRIVFSPKPLGREKRISAYLTSQPAFRSALKGSAFYSDRVIRRRTGRPVLVMAAPIRARSAPHKIVGVVVAHYGWSSVQRILDQVDPATTVHLLDRTGFVIGKRSNDPLSNDAAGDERQGIGGEGYATTFRPTHGGEPTLAVEQMQTGLLDYRGSGWKLRLEQPMNQAFAPISRIARETALVVLASLMLLAAIHGVLGRRLMRPLSTLVEGVRHVAEGRLGERVDVRSTDEFSELAHDFNIMVERLEDRTRQLLAAQEDLVRHEKLALLGQIAAAVGNELRNPLGVMSNAVYYLQNKLPVNDPDNGEYLDIIQDEISNAARILSDLLDAVQTMPPRPRTVDTWQIVRHTLEICAIPRTIAIQLDIPEDLPPIHADPGQLQRAIRNLVTNGVEAMPDGGSLTIRAHAGDDPVAVIVEISDTGIGIPPENMERLFQPLFSTKSRGIGLGLLVAKNLLETNHATIRVRSTVGAGTTFTLTLPVGDASTSAQAIIDTPRTAHEGMSFQEA